MRVTKATGHFEITINLGNYQNVRPSATVEVEVENTSFLDAASEARRLAREQVGREIKGLIESQLDMIGLRYLEDVSNARVERFIYTNTQGELFPTLKMLSPKMAEAVIEPIQARLIELKEAEEERRRAEAEAQAMNEQNNEAEGDIEPNLDEYEVPSEADDDDDFDSDDDFDDEDNDF